MRLAVIFIVLLILFTTAIGATITSEPNNTDFEIKFVIDSNTPVEWSVFLNRLYQGRRVRGTPSGPIRPTYAASMRLVTDEDSFSINKDNVLIRINDSPVAKKFSKSQREFLKTGFAVWVEGDPEEPFQYYMICLYAVSEEDARLMTRAYLDGLSSSADQAIGRCKSELSKNQEKVRVTQKNLSEKESKLKACEEKYKHEKESTHKFTSDGEAYDLANDTILEMSKALDRLEIEMISIRAKLDAIEKYRNKTAQSDALHAKLEEMSVVQMIELSGLQARWAATESLRAKQQAFLNVYNERRDLEREVGVLIKTIDSSETIIKDMTELLAHPKANTMFGNMLLPKVYQNTITIHPVLTK